MDNGIYTKGKSFRAVVEAKARKYRTIELNLPDYDTYGHILTDKDSKRGMNFLPSMREEIYRDVIRRNEKGKGVDIIRTTKNMLSSQAMCFNLFAPLNKNKKLAASFFNFLLGNVLEIKENVDFEYTPLKSIFNDQSGKGGVDCDALLTYTNKQGKSSILVIETKFVEPEFSICGFRKRNQNDTCPSETVILKDYSNCRYHHKKKYNYWKVAEESNLFKMDLIHTIHCPFGGSLWQLWTNMSLAYALAKERGIEDFSYAIICPERNYRLLNNGKTFDTFKKLLVNPNKLKIIYLLEVKSTLEKVKPDFSDTIWIDEFISRYCN
jgi:hypothetical protein